MAITNFIPEVWASKMLVAFREANIWAALTNREYEGDLRRGNTVHITSPVDIEIKDYSATRTTTPDEVTDTTMELLVDQEKSFDFIIDDIDKAQAAGEVSAYAESAAYGLAEDSDLFLSTLAATSGTPVTPTTQASDGDTAWNVLRDLRKTLNKASVPRGNRVTVVNAEFEGLLLDASSKITSVDLSGSPAGLREGVIGSILGSTVFGSEHMPQVDVPMAITFHLSSIAYVSQIQKTEAMRAGDKFADRLRGLHVYGGEVVRPGAIAVYTHADAGTGTGG